MNYSKKLILIKAFYIVVIALFVTSLLYLGLTPIKRIVDNCEDRGWDGSEYDTGVKDIKPFRENNPIIVKCNKKETETDAIVGVVNALWFWDYHFALQDDGEKQNG